MAIIWKSYRGGPTKSSADVTNISINNKGVISFNRRALNLLNDAGSVLLMFDDQNSIIGVIPAPPRSAEAFPLKKKNGSNWVVNAAPFCCHFRISPHETERFDDPDLDDEGILRLDLKRTHNVTRRKRREKARTA